jgi:hypothetical protein
LLIKLLDGWEFAMISSVLALAIAVSMQPGDTTRAAREAFTGCLRTYVDRSAQAHMTPADFATAYPRQCSAEQQAYRTAVIARETASRASRADAEESAGMEIEEARTNFSERFDMAQPAPAPATAQPAAPAAAATAQAAAQPAGQQTPAPQPASSPN